MRRIVQVKQANHGRGAEGTTIQLILSQLILSQPGDGGQRLNRVDPPTHKLYSDKSRFLPTIGGWRWLEMNSIVALRHRGCHTPIAAVGPTFSTLS